MRACLSLFAIFLFFFTGRLLCGQEPFLSVEIKPSQTVARNHEKILVEVAIRNNGATRQTLSVYTCSFPNQWQVDNAAVDVDRANCLQNLRTEIKLKPGEVYRRSLFVHVQLASDQIEQRKESFRLGFGNSPNFGYLKPGPNYPAIWSNAVTVTVTK